MRDALGFLTACLLAAWVPFCPHEVAATSEPAFPGWPARWEGRALRQRSATPAEAAFARRFPGRIAAFDDGQRHLLLRYVTQPTRRLHPASDCYRGAGYTTEARPLRVDHEGRRWGCFRAQGAEGDLQVCESISDGRGRTWSDVSSWYWAAALEGSPGPWWAVTVAEAQPHKH
jgi:hypothetical protein